MVPLGIVRLPLMIHVPFRSTKGTGVKELKEQKRVEQEELKGGKENAGEEEEEKRGLCAH